MLPKIGWPFARASKLNGIADCPQYEAKAKDANEQKVIKLKVLIFGTALKAAI